MPGKEPNDAGVSNASFPPGQSQTAPPPLKGRAASIHNWTAVDEPCAVGEFTARLLGGARERVREAKATVEQGIEELKSDLEADDFCPQNFRATEAVFLAVLFTFNLRSLYRQQASPQQSYRQPATLRAPARAAPLGQLGGQHKPLRQAVLGWRNATRPKWIPPETKPPVLHAEFDQSCSVN